MSVDPTVRARRLLRWYPASWRRRYGVEFAALMEEELAERPHAARRTVDIVLKGLASRATDLGLNALPIEPAARTNSGLATTICASVLFAGAALHPWAWTMLTWNGWDPQRAGVVQTVTTGLMTALLFALLAILAVSTLALAASAVIRVIRHRQWRLVVPAGTLLFGFATLAVSSHYVLRYAIARGGVNWFSPGLAIKQLAGAAYVEITGITDITGTSFAAHTSLTYDVWRIVPVASLLLIGVSMAFLIRMMPMGASGASRCRRLEGILTTLMVLFMGSYLAWFLGANVHVFGGNDSFEAVAFIGMLMTGSVGIACARSSWHYRLQPH